MPVVSRSTHVTPRHVVMVVGARGIPDVEGGAEKNAEMLFPYVAAAGYRVVLLGLEGLVKSDSYKGVELQRAPNKRMLKTDKLAYYLYAISLARSIRPDIVHLQGLGASLFLWAYKLMGVRVVVRYGSADYVVSKWGVIGRLGFRLAEYQTRFADAVIAVAPSLAQRLARNGIRDNVHVIANAIDEGAPCERDDTLSGEMAKAPFILMVGRVTAQKNVYRTIEGFQRFRKAHGLPHRLLIAGGLEDVDYVESLRPLLDDNVTLLGRCNRQQLEGLYRDCAVYVNSSLHEGSSNAVLEAIGRQAPIILSGIPENRDFGVDEHFFFDPDDADALANAMGRAVADPASYTVNRSHFMDWPQVAEKTLAVYTKIMA